MSIYGLPSKILNLQGKYGTYIQSQNVPFLKKRAIPLILRRERETQVICENTGTVPSVMDSHKLMWIRIRLITLMRVRILILFDADPDFFHPDTDPDPDPSFYIQAQTLEQALKYAHIPFILACHLQIDADPGQVPDPSNHFDADPDADSDPDFYFMRIRMRIWIFI
jgi:hypothetical protein